MARESAHQAHPPVGEAEPVDPAALSPDIRAGTKPSSEVPPQTVLIPKTFAHLAVSSQPGSLQEVQKEVKEEVARVSSRERLSGGEEPAPAAGGSKDPGSGARDPGPAELQEVLPRIESLAQRVGGLKQLADLVATLQQAKEE